MSEQRPDGRGRTVSPAAAVALVMAAVLASVGVPGPAGSALPGSTDRPALPVRAAAPARTAQEHGDQSLKAEYDEVLGQEAELIARVEEAQAERVRLTGELDRLESELTAKQAELVGAQADLDEAEDLAAIYAQALDDAQAKVRAAVAQLRKQIVASYVSGGEDADLLAALLNATNGEEAGQALAFSKAVVGDSDALVDRLEAAREEVREADKAARSARRTSRIHRDEVKAAAEFIAAARDEKKRLVDAVNLQVVAEAQALREVQGRKALVEGRINAMTQSSDGVAMILADLQKGQPDWVPGAVVITSPIPGYHIGSKFGLRHHPILDVDRLHAGGDIGAPSGTPIHAAADGLVVIAGVRGGYGNTVVIDHGNSLGTLYGHQSAIAVDPGQIVQRGDIIGYVGSTGLSTGPHLHFETRVRGMPIDPEGVVDFDLVIPYASERAGR